MELYKKSPFKLIKYKELSDDIDEGWCDAIPDKEEYEDFVIWAAEYGEMILDEGIGFDEKFRGFVLVYIAARLGDEDAQYKLANVYGEDSEFVKCDLDKKNYWMNQSYLRGNKKAADYIWR